MNETQNTYYLVINQMNQPVELHLLSGLVVLPPRGRQPLDAADLGSPQLQVLRSTRRIVTQLIEPIAVTEKAAEPPPAAEGERGEPSTSDPKNQRQAPSGGKNAV